MKLVLILPTYNERENIVKLLDLLHEALGDEKRYQVSYLVADDNSPDGTSELVEKYQKTHKDVFLISGKKEGLGKAMLRAMTYAVDRMGAEYLFQMDADLSHDPRIVPKFLRALDEGADFVVGSRYIAGGSIPSNWGVHRKIFSVVGNAIVRFGLGYPRVHDWTGGFRAYKKIFFEQVKNELDQYSGYVFQIAFLHKSIMRSAHIVEVPIHFTDRLYGRSKIAPFEYIKNVFLYVFFARLAYPSTRSFVKFLIVGSVGFVVNTIILEAGVFLGYHPAAASVVGAEFAILSNFLLNNAWTFRERKIHTKTRKLLKFIQFNGTSLGAIAIQSGIVYIGTHLYGLSEYRIFYIFGVLIGLVWNYLMYSRVIWKKHAKDQ
jgi:dolichol-phosphate mannosyltransferase